MAGQAFLKMRQRIRRHIEQRTLMLAGVSHDLRTPLTRLKLQLAMQDDTPDTLAARRDVDEMDAMLNGYLDFARGMGEEKTQTMRLSEFLETAIAETVDVTIAPFDDQAISVRPLMLRRALGNLINNALKYGTKCKMAIEVQAGFISFHVDDDGPGIPETQRPDVFKAFQRLDDARNQNVEGVGSGPVYCARYCTASWRARRFI